MVELLILAVLLFGVGAVLGFLDSLIWLILAILVICFIIWLISKIPSIATNVIEDQKEAYKEHPTGVIISTIMLVIFVILLFIYRDSLSF